MENLDKLPAKDSDWSEEDWKSFIDYLAGTGLVSYKEICSAVLSALNPPQVGTAIASNKNFQSHYPPRETMKNVMSWFYNRQGVCVDCGPRLELQADHIIPRESFDNKADADYL